MSHDLCTFSIKLFTFSIIANIHNQIQMTNYVLFDKEIRLFII